MRASRNKHTKQGDMEMGVEDSNDHSGMMGTLINVDDLAGKIDTLQMINFMCHSNLELKFNRMINFITGKNGSGKSTIMAALIVVLGGTATVTGRASKITNFIKKGENWAKVSVTLVNEGINAYKKEIYGPKIIICRNITSTGSNSYVCKSHSGGVVSKKKEEVDRILLAFNWQIKNPICVLNQDVARSFLCANDNEMRFNMFMRATQLEHLELIYKSTEELQYNTEKQLESKKKEISTASEEIKKLKKKLELLASLEKHVHERTSLENEYMWSLVGEAEQKINTLLKQKTHLEEKKKDCSKGENEHEKIVNDLQVQIKEHQKKFEELNDLKKEKKIKKSEIKSSMLQLERQIEKSESQMKQWQAKVERNLGDVNAVKEHLTQCETNSGQSQEEKNKAQQEIVTLHKSLSEIKEKVKSMQKEIDDTQESKAEQLKAMETLKLDLGEIEQNKRRLEIIAAGSKNRGQNYDLKYGPFTSELKKAIDDAFKKNQFHKKPVGPCGMYVRLTGDPKWARAVESVIGGLMCTYCCDNQKDFQVLTHLMDKCCGPKQPPIIISKFLPARHNVEDKKASVRDHPSILDVLTIDHDIVFNTFIDQARIETIVLFEKDSQAASVMSHIQNVPKNLKMGLTLSSDQYYPAPNYRTYYGDASKPLKFFAEITKTIDTIKKIESELNLANEALHDKNSELVLVREKYIDLCENLKRLEKNVKLLKQEECKVQVNLNHLKDIEDSRPVAITKIALEEELQNLQKCYEESVSKISVMKESLQALRNEKTELDAKLKTLDFDEHSLDEQLKQEEEKIEDFKLKQTRLNNQKRKANSLLVEINKSLATVAEDISKCKTDVEEKIRAAEEVCPDRVNTEKSPIEVHKLLEKCERYLKTAEKELGSKEATIEEYKAKYSVFKSMRKREEILESALAEIKKSTLTKVQRLEILRSSTTNLVSLCFQATLRTRGYDGQLKIDFDNKILDLEVTPKDATKARSDAKTLSGGERSYTTVSFILAIWRAMNMPVYFLDEFDVFMDKVNRKVIMNLLLEYAKEHYTSQFVFITPQDISDIQACDKLTVFRLSDPERKRSSDVL